MSSSKQRNTAAQLSRSETPTPANSIRTFAESLRMHRTPSPTDDEVAQIWEAARTARPIFPDLNLQRVDSGDLRQAAQAELPTTFHLSPGQRAIVRDATDTAGNHQSVLLVYETDYDDSMPSTRVPTQKQTSYDDCVADYASVPSVQSPVWPARSSSRRHMPEVTPALTPAPRAATIDESVINSNGKSKGKAGIYRLKQAFKLAKPSKSNSSAPAQKYDSKPNSLPKVQPVDPSSSMNTRPQPAQPVPRKVVGDANRMTVWGDFSQYKAEDEAPKSARLRPPSLHLNKPLPDIPHAGSHLRVTRAPGSFFDSSNRSSSSPSVPSQGRSKHRRTAVYAGSIFSCQELSEEEVIDAYASSPSSSHAATQTPGTSDDESEGERERRQLLEHLHGIDRAPLDEAFVQSDTLCRFPHRSQSVNVEIGRLNDGLGRTFDADDEDDKSPMIDTFVHAGHTSFLITERLKENTIRSMYGTQERLDGDSPTDDPTKAVWQHLASQVGGGGWSGE